MVGIRLSSLEPLVFEASDNVLMFSTADLTNKRLVLVAHIRRIYARSAFVGHLNIPTVHPRTETSVMEYSTELRSPFTRSLYLLLDLLR